MPNSRERNQALQQRRELWGYRDLSDLTPQFRECPFSPRVGTHGEHRPGETFDVGASRQVQSDPGQETGTMSNIVLGDQHRMSLEKVFIWRGRRPFLTVVTDSRPSVNRTEFGFHLLFGLEQVPQSR
jgi:hypothetical protein